MKKNYLLFGIFLVSILLFQSIFAVNLNVQKLSNNEVMIKGLDQPANFKINVTNKGPSDSFSLYTFFGMGLTPSQPIKINSGQSKVIDFQIAPRTDSTLQGYVSFNYFIQGTDKSESTENLTVKILPLKDAFNIGAESINPDSNTMNISLNNDVNFNFQNLNVTLSSPFFNYNGVMNLSPYSKKEITMNLDKANFSKLIAGFYTLNANFEIGNVSANIAQPINFVEKNIIKEEKKQYGFIISTTIITKTNEGNAVGNSQVTINKNIISRVFTSFSPAPTTVSRSGSTITYTWDKSLNPGESYEVQVRTNWLIPLLIIILIVLTIVFARKFSRTDVVVRKRVSFLNAKGGEFALKVMVNIEAKNFVEDVKVFDRLPPLVKIYEKFGGELPKRFNKTRKVFEWELGDLEAGERRFLSYVIYSKVGVLGRFALPSSRAVFKREGKEKEVSSNKAFFLADQSED